jgi:hypothetical protein
MKTMKIKSIQQRMVYNFFLISFFSLAVYGCNNQTIPSGSLYLSQTPPGTTPVVFPLSVRQGYFAAERIAISNGGKDIYFSEIKSYYPIKGENIKRYTFSGGKWIGPSDLFDGYAPALSVTGDTLFFERKDLENNSEAYISVRKGRNWGPPKRIFTKLIKAHYCQITGHGNYYISTNSGNGVGLNDWCRVIINGTDSTAQSFGRPLNNNGENLDYYVSPDESFMIVTNRPGLAISYRKPDGSWTNPRNFGPKIDFGLGSWGPWVTADNKYMFYSTGTKSDYSDVAVYWVRIEGVIDSMKHTNLSPYIKSLIKDQPAIAGQNFTFIIPENIFFDDDNIVPLKYSAALFSGDPLPAWLKFDQETRTFYGTPGEPGELIVRIVVTDSEKATAFCPVKIIVTDSK